MADNEYNVGDETIVLHTQNKDKLALAKGGTPTVGDEICVQHTQDKDIVTHGTSEIVLGDEVVVVHSQDKDRIALRTAAPNPIRQCVRLNNSIIDNTGSGGGYDIHLDRPVSPNETLNIRFSFDVSICASGDPEHNCDFQCWYPCGGVTLGYGATNVIGGDMSGNGVDNYYWPDGNPYMVIAGGPWIDLTTRQGLFGYVLGQPGGPMSWCCDDLLGHTYPGGISNFDVEWIHVNIRTNSTLFFTNCDSAKLMSANMCTGPVDVGWCERMIEVYGD